MNEDSDDSGKTEEWWKACKMTPVKRPIGDLIAGALFWFLGMLVLLLILAAIRAAGGSY